MVKVRFRFRDMVKTTFLNKNFVPGSTKYVDLGTRLTQQNQDVPEVVPLFSIVDLFAILNYIVNCYT